MHIAIIGGGLTGLTAAYELLKNKHEVTIFEKDSTLGGLAGGFHKANWQWSLEYFYHHFFTNDNALITLSKELGLEKDMLIVEPITATLTNTHAKTPTIYQLDSPKSLLMFPLLSPVDKIRTACLIGFCKINPFWQPLEKITAKTFFTAIGGSSGWQILWEPLMKGKFGTYTDSIPASWLWARLNKRTMKLGYFYGGFRTFVEGLVRAIEKKGGIIKTQCPISTIKYLKGKNNSQFVIHNCQFDKVLFTTPSSIATKLIQFPPAFEKKLNAISHLYAQTLILETEKPILDSIYWLNINDRSYPFLAVVAHTNMIEKKYYGNHHITYIGNYLPAGHPYLSMTKEQLLKTFLPYIKKINPSFIYDRRSITYDLFTAPNAQPIHTLNYSKKAPPIETPIQGIFLANLDSIFPWDRGTNYAVELGLKTTKCILSV